MNNKEQAGRTLTRRALVAGAAAGTVALASATGIGAALPAGRRRAPRARWSG